MILCNPPKRFATGALSGRSGEDVGSLAILISVFVTPGGGGDTGQTGWGSPVGHGGDFVILLYLKALFFEMRGAGGGKK